MSRTAPAIPPKADTATLAAVVCAGSLACAWGLMIIITGWMSVVNTLTAPAVTLPQPTSVDITPGASGSLQIVEGAYRTADITVSGVSDGVRTMLLSSTVFDALMHLSVVFGVILLCVALIRGRPFMPAMVRTLVFMAFTLALCGMLSSGLHGFANMEVARALDHADFPLMANLDFTSAIVGIALALVATAFKAGERLQRDTEGLI